MTLHAKHNALSIIIFLMIVVCLGACSTFSFKPAQEVLQSRVDGFMKAKINNEWGELYEYYCSSYKEAVSRDKFLTKSRMCSDSNYEIESIEISPAEDEATVKVKTDKSVMGFDFPGIIITQKWLKEGWNWYLYVDSKPTRSLP
jgi:hypothetical protein